MTALFFLFFRRRIYPVVIPPTPSSSCHQFRFLLLFHFFSFRRDGVAVVQLEKTQEPKEKRKRHDEVREWGGRVSTVDTIQSILTFRRAPSLYKSSDGRKRRTFSFVVPDEKKEKKTSADDKVELLMEQTGELEEKAPTLGALIHQPPSAYILLRTANVLPRIISRGREKRSREENSAQDFRDCTTCNEEEKKRER